MPVHDWARVDPGTFHAFHTAWVTHLSEAMNEGLLPRGYYAMPEQHVGRSIADVLTLHAGPNLSEDRLGADEGGLAVAEAPPRVRQRLTASGSAAMAMGDLVLLETAASVVLSDDKGTLAEQVQRRARIEPMPASLVVRKRSP